MVDYSALLVGESWQTVEFHVKGFDLFSRSGYIKVIDALRADFEAGNIQTTY